MNVTTQQKPVLNHDEIARLARHIWHADGGQSGRDQEYWMQAEQLLAISQPGNGPANNVPVNGKVPSPTGRNSARPAAPARSIAANPQKQAAKNLVAR